MKKYFKKIAKPSLRMKMVWRMVTILSVVGVILAAFLLYNFYAVVPSAVCNLSAKFNCEAVSKGSLATFAGVPVALVGLIGYAAILFAALTKKKKLVLAMSAFGMVFCLRITILELFFVKIYCPVCLACQLVMLLIFLASVFLNYSKS